MTDRVRVAITRTCWLRGKVLDAGSTVSVVTADAGALIDAGRARLVDDADAARVNSARAAAARVALQQAMATAPPDWRRSWP